ncbi:hypothetical protein NHQ30_000954 [Ciborinia camelliae]|nr:hypothetical protein NHQ30_000954 [Ciborinia camelliae]
MSNPIDPVIAICILDHSEFLDMLLENISGPSGSNHKTAQLDSALAGAVFGGHLDLVQRLIGASADVNASVECSMNLTCRILHLAAYEGNLSIIRALLHAGAGADIKEWQPAVPEWGLTAQLLFQYYPNACERNLETQAYQLYLYNHPPNPINWLINPHLEARWSCTSAFRNDYLKVAELLIRRGASIGSVDEAFSPWYRIAKGIKFASEELEIYQFFTEMLELFAKHAASKIPPNTKQCDSAATISTLRIQSTLPPNVDYMQIYHDDTSTFEGLGKGGIIEDKVPRTARSTEVDLWKSLVGNAYTILEDGRLRLTFSKRWLLSLATTSAVQQHLECIEHGEQLYKRLSGVHTKITDLFDSGKKIYYILGPQNAGLGIG